MATATAPAPKPAKTTKAPAAPAKGSEDAKDKMAKLREARERASKDDKFTYLGGLKEGAKRLAPQAEGILNIIQAAGKKGITRENLVKEMNGVITTKQPLGRILSYYQQELVDKGVAKWDKAAVEPKAKAAKAAPAPKGDDDGAGEGDDE